MPTEIVYMYVICFMMAVNFCKLVTQWRLRQTKEHGVNSETQEIEWGKNAISEFIIQNLWVRQFWCLYQCVEQTLSYYMYLVPK